MGRSRLIVISTLAIVLGVGTFGAVLLTRFWNASLQLVADREALFSESRARLLGAELERIEKAIGRISRVAEIDLADGNLEPEKRFVHVAKESALFAMGAAVIDGAGQLLWADPSLPPELPLMTLARDARDGRVHTTLAGGRILMSTGLRGGGAFVGTIDPATPHFLGPNLARYVGKSGHITLHDDPTAAAGQRWVTDAHGREWLRTTTPVGYLGLQMVLSQAVDEIDDPLAVPFRSLVAIVAIELLAAVAAGGFLARALGRVADVERELARTEKLAAMGSTAAAIAHELKNALNGLSVAVDLVAFGGAPPDKAVGIRAQIRSEMDRLRRITDDLTFFSGPARLELAPVDLPDLLGRVPAILADRILDEAVTVELDVDGERAAEGTAPLQVQGDEHRLLGVFVNLAHNAIDAMRPTALRSDKPSERPERPRRLRIAARAVPAAAGRPALAEMSFTDSGAGIAPEIRSTMFEPFVTTKRTGTGLGLAIARKVIEAHGGTIAAQDAPDGGTTFAVRLPLSLKGANR